MLKHDLLDATAVLTLFTVTRALQSDAKTVNIKRENTVEYTSCYTTYLRILQTHLHCYIEFLRVLKKPANCIAFSLVYTEGSREVVAFLILTSPFNLQAILETVKTGHFLRDLLKRVPTCDIIDIRIYFCVLFGLS